MVVYLLKMLWGVTEANSNGIHRQPEQLWPQSPRSPQRDADPTVSLTTPMVFTVTRFKACDFLELCVLETVSS